MTLPVNPAQYDTLELDMTLGCPGTLDTDCPQWDHVVCLSLHACRQHEHVSTVVHAGAGVYLLR